MPSLVHTKELFACTAQKVGVPLVVSVLYIYAKNSIEPMLNIILLSNIII